ALRAIPRRIPRRAFPLLKQWFPETCRRNARRPPPARRGDAPAAEAGRKSLVRAANGVLHDGPHHADRGAASVRDAVFARIAERFVPCLSVCRQNASQPNACSTAGCGGDGTQASSL